jgi:hypothetical protein
VYDGCILSLALVFLQPSEQYIVMSLAHVLDLVHPRSISLPCNLQIVSTVVKLAQQRELKQLDKVTHPSFSLLFPHALYASISHDHAASYDPLKPQPCFWQSKAPTTGRGIHKRLLIPKLEDANLAVGA